MQNYAYEGDPFGFRSAPADGSGRRPDFTRGAENLLVKTAAAWADGDQEKAARLLDLAARRPFDRREGIWPGPAAAHLLLFELVTHTVETSEPRDWFAAVEATFATLDETHRAALCDALVPLVADWDLAPQLAPQVRRLVADHREDVSWQGGDLAPAEVRAMTERVLRVAVRLSAELDQRGLCAHLAPEYWSA